VAAAPRPAGAAVERQTGPLDSHIVAALSLELPRIYGLSTNDSLANEWVDLTSLLWAQDRNNLEHQSGTNGFIS
jgi:hypothetical protein